MLELSKVSYTYPLAQEPTLHNISFAVQDKHTGIIGPNGCGKTTLLHLMVGLIKPAEGELLFNGEPVTTKLDMYNLRRDVGFLFQSSDDQLFSPTVIEDVAFGPLNLGFKPDEARAIAEKTLKNLGLEGFEDRITHKLSGGEKKLVALATILAMRPKVLLLDEPTNNLDPKTTSRLIEILQNLDLHQVIISHDWDFLSHTTNVLYKIDHGHIHKCEEDHIHIHRHVHRAGDHPHEHNL
ncbi:MAG: cobalt/nickel transport system ATP-binding protein [Desulforhopalus sp.]|jgi:cobalt/nickel transport system ATP-binding protein